MEQISANEDDDIGSLNRTDSITSFLPHGQTNSMPSQPNGAKASTTAATATTTTRSEYDLSDIFYTSQKKGVFRVLLNENGFQLERESSSGSKTQTVQLADIIGGRCMRAEKQPHPLQRRLSGACACTSSSSSSSSATTNSTPSKDATQAGGDNSAYLYVFAYVLKKNLRCTLRRERTVLTLRFRSFDSFDMNMREAEKWHQALMWHKKQELAAMQLEANMSPVPLRRRLLVLLNPKSGSGKARDQFHQQVAPVLNEADLPFDLYVTKHANYAREFVHGRNLAMWSGVVAVGGDGLFFEILNGVLERPDWAHVLQRLALGIVPCGSGNGLAKSLAHSFKEPFDPKPILGAALTIISGRTFPMDVIRVELKNHILYSFLSIGWGLISDIDIESERLRALGYQRFTLWTLHRLISLRTYRGKVSYLLKGDSPADDLKEAATAKPADTTPQLKHSLSCGTYLNRAKQNGNRRQSADGMNLNGGGGDFEDVISLETSVNYSFRSRCDSWFSAGSRKSTYYSIAAESVYHSVGGDSGDLNGAGGDARSDCYEHDLMALTTHAMPKATAPPLNAALPDNWIVEEGDFVMVQAAYQTHLGIDCHFAPLSQLNDGTIYLVIIRGGISRSQLLNFMIGMSSGTHIPTKHNDYVKVVAVTAFRIEPDKSDGILTVDGERVEFGALQAEVLPGIANVMVPK